MKDYSKQYFTTVSLSDGTIIFNGSFIRGTQNTLMYSKDGGKTWSYTSYGLAIIVIRVKSGDRILWKGHAMPNDVNGIGRFESTAPFLVEGNIMSLLFGDNFNNKTDLSGYDGAFHALFLSCTYLVNAANLVLPATTLANTCYCAMFMACTNLKEAPQLNATTLSARCYSGMFHGCTSLTTAPSLPATTLAEACYQHMFNGCTSLMEAPELPATTLTIYCYCGMFYGCTSLTTAPELHATKLTECCYDAMFMGCSSLKKTKLLFIDKQDVLRTKYMYDNCNLLKLNPIIIKQ